VIERYLIRLSPRERQILPLVCKGWSNKQIARELGMADSTVKVHLHAIYGKLEIHNRTLLAAMAGAAA
jgi:DNA-binding NarL/FixJ family response regulator